MSEDITNRSENMYNETVIDCLDYLQKNQVTLAYLCTSDNNPTDAITFDSDSQPLILDTGASCGFTYNRKDFIKYQSYKGNVTGLGTLSIQGMGTVSYKIRNNHEDIVDLVISNVFHVPNLHIRLVSPQQIAKQS